MVGSGYFGRIWIQMFWSETDSSILIGYESGYFGWSWIRLYDVGSRSAYFDILIGSGSGYDSRISIKTIWLDTDPAMLVGSSIGYFGRIQIQF